MPSFIAATEPLPAAPTIERNVRDFFSFFSCSHKKRTRSSFPKEKICRFLTDEKTTKRVAETPVSDSHASAGKRIHTARRCCSARNARTGHHTPCGEFLRLEKPAPAGARLPERTRCPLGVFRRGLHELTSANTCWEPTECALGSHKRSSRRLAVLLMLFFL